MLSGFELYPPWVPLNEVGSDRKRNNKPSERGAGKGKGKPYIITTSVSSLEDDNEYRRLYVT